MRRRTALFFLALVIAILISGVSTSDVPAQGIIEGWITYLTSEGAKVDWPATGMIGGDCNLKIWVPSEKTNLIEGLTRRGWNTTDVELTKTNPGYVLMDYIFRGMPCPPPPPAASASEGEGSNSKGQNQSSSTFSLPAAPPLKAPTPATMAAAAFGGLGLVVVVILLLRFAS